MTAVDWFILGVFFSAAVGGYRLGFITRATSWLGAIAGFIGALILLPYALHQAIGMAQSTRFSLIVLLVVAGSLLGQMLGLFVGSKLTVGISGRISQRIDKCFGAIVGVVGVVVALWLLLPTAANIPGLSAHTVRGSTIARAIHDNGPSLPDPLLNLQRLAGTSGFPSVFEGIGESPEAGPAPKSIVLAQDVISAVKESTVKVEGLACRRTQNGTGFVVAPNLIMTNAHVIAGESATNVIANDGTAHTATVVFFDPVRDIALLNTPGMSAPPLNLDNAKVGDIGAVFGHPNGVSNVVLSPAKVHQEIIAVGRDLYNKQSTRRKVLILAAPLQHGDSGGPLIDTDGNVIGMAFAIAPDKPNTSYALGTSELEAALAQPRDGKVDTGKCLDN